MERTRNYYPTKAQSFTAGQWLMMLKETDCFTPVLLEAVCALVFEMDGKGSASQISAITGRPRQSYNSAPCYTVKRLRKRGYSIPADYRRSSGKERYWSHFFLGYYEDKLFVWKFHAPGAHTIAGATAIVPQLFALTPPPTVAAENTTETTEE